MDSTKDTITEKYGTAHVVDGRLESTDIVLDAATQSGTETVTVPVIEETLTVGKRTVEAGRVRIHKTVEERQETVDIPLLRETVTVERVTIGRIISEPVAIRYEGDITIIPIVEETLVVEKRLLLKEELHITRQQTTIHDPQTVTLRREEVDIENIVLNADTTVSYR